MEKLLKKGPFKLILIVMGLIHIIGFFAFPFAHLGKNSIGSLASRLGVEDVPENLTGLSAFNLADIFKADAIILKVIVALPLIFGIVIVLDVLLKKKKSVYPDIIGVSAAYIVPYLLVANVAMQDYKQIGYRTNATITLLIILCVVQVVVSIIALRKEKTPSSPSAEVSANAAADSVKKAAKTAATSLKKAADIAGVAINAAGKAVITATRNGKVTGVSGGAYDGVEIPLADGVAIVIGCDPANCNIVIQSERVSPVHCQIVYYIDNNIYIVRDLSANGTFSEAKGRLNADGVPLKSGDVIRICDSGHTFRLG